MRNKAIMCFVRLLIVVGGTPSTALPWEGAAYLSCQCVPLRRMGAVAAVLPGGDYGGDTVPTCRKFTNYFPKSRSFSRAFLSVLTQFVVI